nr:RNA-directed DNA polymerase, eukaryota [Tanacetum cinerariifolium]
WDGEVIVMGDFNEVRFKNERFGSLFHAHGADAFNRFILQENIQEIPLGGCSFTLCHRSAKKMSKLDRFLMSEGLLGENPNFLALTLDRFGSLFHAHGADAFNRFILQANIQEIPLGGCSFTWCHRSAKKMSKLDRFLMSEGLLGKNPNFLALTLDRYLSDHRPIMLRDSSHDYGPIPFRMYHYWFEIDRFEEMISKAWCECPIVEVNPMLYLMYKMKFLKKCIYQGNATDDILYKRMEIIKDIQEADKEDNLEAA